jgi:DNA-binding Lrp family transcriptional regulator
MRIKIRKRYLFYILVFSSAILSALTAGFDAVSQIYITNPFALGLACFLLGVIVAIFFSLILSIRVKDKTLGEKIIDPSFKGIRFIRKEEVFYQVIAGAGNAIMTIGYFLLLSIFKGNVSIVLPFSQVVILYLVIIESLSEKDTPTLVEVQSAMIVTFGAILGSISLSGNLNVFALSVVFFVICPGWVLLSFYQRKLKLLRINDRSNDAINIRLWNVIFSFIFTAIMIFSFDVLTGSNHLMQGLIGSMNHYLWVGAIAVGTFFSFIFYIRALGIGKASVTQAVRASVIVFSIPVTIVLGYLGIAEKLTTDPVMVIVKIMGITMMMLGIASYALTLTKAYVFIKMKTGYSIEETMEKIWKIKGINRVSATAGHYDFIIKIRTRTLIKGYERILRKVQEIPGIDECRWESVLKEWEDI